METFQVQCMIDEVARAKHDLMALTLDDSVTPDRFAKCEVAASDLESAVTELLTTAWVPKNLHELAACIVCVNENLKHVQSDVAAALDVVLLECRPDELYLAFIALSFSRLLEFERGILCDALVNCMKCPCGCGAFVPKGWIN